MWQLQEILERLPEAPAPPEFEDPFVWILWEQVAYLAKEPKRQAAFARLAAEVGLSADAVHHASLETLIDITRSGGAIGFELRARRMKDSAQRVLADWQADLRPVLRLPLKSAIRELTKFPMIGKPGAQKILLFMRVQRSLALESNGLRVLLRLGFGVDHDDYGKRYASIMAAVEPLLPVEFDAVIAARQGLQRHGQTTCRNTRPRCTQCELRARCPMVGVSDNAHGD